MFKYEIEKLWIIVDSNNNNKKIKLNIIENIYITYIPKMKGKKKNHNFSIHVFFLIKRLYNLAVLYLIMFYS